MISEDIIMKNNIKNIIVTFVFMIFIFGVMLGNVFAKDTKLSFSERRTLAGKPKYSHDKLIDGSLFEGYEKYFLDQFIFRDTFRAIKAYGEYHLLHQKDNNNIYMIDGKIYKMLYPLNEKAIHNAANKINEVYEKYLQDKNVYYSIIPDKNYFTAKENAYLHLDYERMQEIMDQNVKHMKYLDLFDVLTIDDYYDTDIHWKQDEIIDVADHLLEGMDNNFKSSNDEYSRKERYPFYGSYYGQAAIKFNPDTLVYLINTRLEHAMVYDYETELTSNIYIPEEFGGMDSYNLFLSGAKPLLTITNPEAATEKELILFRDSFGSSIAPLLLGGYSKITLVDLRYIATDLLDKYIDFTMDQDVLFLYNTEILNNSYMLK